MKALEGHPYTSAEFFSTELLKSYFELLHIDQLYLRKSHQKHFKILNFKNETINIKNEMSLSAMGRVSKN